MKATIELLNQELLETIDYFDKGEMLHPVWLSIFFQMRGIVSSSAISSFDGYKLIFSPSKNENITEVVKRGLLFADLVILNHSEIEIEPRFCMFVLPADFPTKMPTKHQYDYSFLQKKEVPPHLVPSGRWEWHSDLYKSPNGTVGVCARSIPGTPYLILDNQMRIRIQLPHGQDRACRCRGCSSSYYAAWKPAARDFFLRRGFSGI